MAETPPQQTTETPLPYSLDYPPPDFIDPVIEVYKKGGDRTIIRENLKLTVEEQLRKAQGRARERGESLDRLAELEEFIQFTRQQLESACDARSLETYLRLWRARKNV